ncbi:MAG: hypothetical protein KA072_13045 [Thermoanaerobaculaceae bacterium]|nr:hypothetical protein [Thermoanaerobaculaceae bacterium]MDI9622913.1 hypothetical protein [Acidobacteriota bacterium]NLH09945.1 hypothetical protein [Holophagae bacterium]HPW56508.1 hypothetical protein [Thermoanaerobaculaceae bacterium]
MRHNKLFRTIMAACLGLGLTAMADVALAGSGEGHRSHKRDRRHDSRRPNVDRVHRYPYRPHARPRHDKHRRHKRDRYLRGNVVLDLGALTLVLPPPPLPPLPHHHRR